MNATIITELAKRVADAAVTQGGDVLSIQMGPMADGSGRDYALATIYACGAESEYRVSSPAPTDAPAWASVYREWMVEMNIGEGYNNAQWVEVEA